jgi:GNAT superfamily N-acetyltransferase
MELMHLKERPEFIPTLAEWHHDQWADYNPGGSVEKRISMFEAEVDTDGFERTFVAVSGDTLLGSASLVEHDMSTRMDLTPWLASVYVAPEHRKKGIASTLVRHIVAEAKDLVDGPLYLFTPDQEKFYAGLGWEFLEETEFEGHRVTIMKIDIA